MDLDDLLEPVEADEDEGVLQLGDGGLLRGHLVDEEAVQGKGLLVDDVLHADVVEPGQAHAGHGAQGTVGGGRGVAPVLAEGGLLKCSKAQRMAR